MNSIGLPPDAILAKFEAEKRWRDSAIGRTESLGDWETIRTEDGSLLLSAQAHGPDPVHVLHRLLSLHSNYLNQRQDRNPDDRMPVLDVSVPDRTGCVWRSGGVWVEVWADDAGTSRTTTGKEATTAARSGALQMEGSAS